MKMRVAQIAKPLGCVTIGILLTMAGPWFEVCVEAQQGRQRSGTSRSRGQDSESYILGIRKAQHDLDTNNLKLLQEDLDRIRPRPGQTNCWEWHYLQALAHTRNASEQALRWTQRGDGQAVQALIWSANGQRFAVLTSNGTLKLFDAADPHKELPSLPGTYSHVVWSPNAQRLAAVTGAAEVKILEIRTGKEIRTFTGRIQSPRSRVYRPDGARKQYPVAWSPDSQRLVLPGVDKNTLQVWDMASGKETLLQGHRDGVTTVAWSPDGRQLFSGSEDGTVRAWQVDTAERIYTLPGFAGDVLAVAPSPDGRRLAIITAGSNSLEVWDLASRRVSWKLLDLSFQETSSLAWNSDSQRLLLQGTVLDGESGRRLVTRDQRFGEGRAAFAPDGQRYILASPASTSETALRLMDTDSDVEIQRFGSFARNEAPTVLAWRPDGKELALGTQQGRLQIWDLERMVDPRRSRRLSNVLSFAWSPTSPQFAFVEARSAYGQRVGPVRIGSVVEHAEPPTVEDDSPGEVMHLALSKDGKRLATTHQGTQQIYLWDPGTGQVSLRLPGHTKAPRFGSSSAYVKELLWSASGKRLLSAATDGTIKIWDAATGAEASSFDLGSSHPRWDATLVWSADDRFLAVGPEATKRVIRILDITTGKLTQSLPTEEGGASCAMAWSPDGEHLAAKAKSQTVHVFHRATGSVEATLSTNASTVWLRYSPDGKRLLVNSNIYDLGSKAFVRLPDGLRGVVWSPDGREIAALARGFNGEIVKVFDAAKGTELQSLGMGVTKLNARGQRREEQTGFPGSLLTLVWTADGLRLAMGNRSDGQIQVVDPRTTKTFFIVRTRARQQPFGRDERKEILALAWRPDGRQLAAQSTSGTIFILDSTGNEVARLSQLATIGGGNFSGLAFTWNPKGQQLTTLSGSGLRVWDLASQGPTKRDLIPTLSKQAFQQGMLTWSPDGQYLAALLIQQHGADVKVWKAATGKELFKQEIDVEQSGFGRGGIAWNSDSKHLAAGVKTLHVWEVTRGIEKASFPDGPGRLLFWRDGRLITYRKVRREFNDSEDELKVWDGLGGAEILTLRGAVAGCQLSSDKRWLASAPAADGLVTLIEIPREPNPGSKSAAKATASGSKP